MQRPVRHSIAHHCVLHECIAMHRQGTAKGSRVAPAKPMFCVRLGPLVTGLEPGQLHCGRGHIDAWCHNLQNDSCWMRQCASLQKVRGNRTG